MADLIPESLEEPQPEVPVFTFEDATAVPKLNQNRKNMVSDILTWVECFNSYTAVLTTFFQSRSRDILAYMALYTEKR